VLVLDHMCYQVEVHGEITNLGRPFEVLTFITMLSIISINLDAQVHQTHLEQLTWQHLNPRALIVTKDFEISQY
jgi:hypothetical protein